MPWISIYGAYLAGVGINAIIPARAGDAVRIVLAHRAIPESTYTTVVSSTLVLSFFDMFAASTLLAWASSRRASCPASASSAPPRASTSPGSSPARCSFELALAAMLVALGVVGFWIPGHVADFRERVTQAFRVLLAADALPRARSRSGRRRTGDCGS